MKKLNKCIFGMLAIGSLAFAGEEFGGIGLSVMGVNEGLSICEVIPGTPAAASGLQAGNLITAVDNVSLEGKSLEESQNLLRGIVNKPIEITYLNEEGINKATLRRVPLYVVEDNNQKGNLNDKELLAILNNGKTGVYLEKREVKANDTKIQKTTSSSISLKGISRNEISFITNERSYATVEITNIDGSTIASFTMKNTEIGNNTLKWNGSKIPGGQYIVSVIQAGKSSSKSIILK